MLLWYHDAGPALKGRWEDPMRMCVCVCVCVWECECVWSGRWPARLAVFLLLQSPTALWSCTVLWPSPSGDRKSAVVLKKKKKVFNLLLLLLQLLACLQSAVKSGWSFGLWKVKTKQKCLNKSAICKMWTEFLLYQEEMSSEVSMLTL